MNDTIKSIPSWLFSILALLAGLAAYGILLALPMPQSVGLAFRYDATYVSLSVALLFFLVFCLPGNMGRFIALLATMAIFALPLAGMWSSSVRDSYILGSLLPTGDATRFYLDATHLLEGWVFDSSGWRPLYPAFLSGLLWFSGQNLQAAVALQGALVALAGYLAARELQRTHGAAAAAVFLMLFFLYSRRFSGTTMTESLGVALGALGLALLWRSAWNGRLQTLMAGSFVTGLALFARPGSLFVLPLLVLWSALRWRNAKRPSWHTAAWVLVVIVLAYSLNSGLAALLTGGGEKQSNFDLTIYGQVVGGKGWNQVHEDYPEVRSLPEPEHSQRVYELAFEAIKERPFLLLQGALKSYAAFFSTAEAGIFGFVGKENSSVTLPLRLLLYALSLIGLAGLYLPYLRKTAGQDRKTPADRGLLAALLAGVILSVPFVPPWDGPGMRLYAASLPLFPLLAGLGVSFLSMRFPKLNYANHAETPQASLPAYAALLSLLVFLPSLLIVATHRQPARLVMQECEQGESLYVRLLPGSMIHIVADQAVPQTHMPDIRQSEFTASNHSFGYTEVADELDRVQVPAAIQNSMDMVTGETVWLITDRGLLPEGGGLVQVCGNWSEGVGLGNWFFYGDEVTPLP